MVHMLPVLARNMELFYFEMLTYINRYDIQLILSLKHRYHTMSFH